MCGRYTVHLVKLGELRALLGVEEIAIEDWVPRFNVAPSQLAPVVVQRESRVLTLQQWGLRSAWGERGPRPTRPINARLETITRVPSFRDAFAKRRCVVPATGYYEWRADPSSGKRVPEWIHPRDPQVMALAGVFETTEDENGETVESFAIVTTEPSEQLVAIHDRMPLELRGDDVERWLSPGRWTTQELAALADRSRDTAHLTHYPVTRAVGSPAFEDPSCIEPVTDGDDATGSQLSLF